LHFDRDGFLGEHRGFGVPVRRRILLGDTTITIRDSGAPMAGHETAIRCVGRGEFAKRFPATVPFSPGYGKRSRAAPAAPA
jgi:hypothetical protein